MRVLLGYGPVAIILLGSLVAACGGGDDPEPGQVGGHCYPNGTCNVGLSCVNGICVAAHPDASIVDASGGHDASGGDVDGAPLDAAGVDAIGCSKPVLFLNAENSIYTPGSDDATENRSSLLGSSMILAGVEEPYASELTAAGKDRLAGYASVVSERPIGRSYSMIALIDTEDFPFPDVATVVSSGNCPAQPNRIAFVRVDGALLRDANRIAAAAGFLAGSGQGGGLGNCMHHSSWSGTVVACTFSDDMEAGGCHASPEDQVAALRSMYLCLE